MLEIIHFKIKNERESAANITFVKNAWKHSSDIMMVHKNFPKLEYQVAFMI